MRQRKTEINYFFYFFLLENSSFNNNKRLRNYYCFLLISRVYYNDCYIYSIIKLFKKFFNLENKHYPQTINSLICYFSKIETLLQIQLKYITYQIFNLIFQIFALFKIVSPNKQTTRLKFIEQWIPLFKIIILIKFETQTDDIVKKKISSKQSLGGAHINECIVIFAKLKRLYFKFNWNTLSIPIFNLIFQILFQIISSNEQTA